MRLTIVGDMLLDCDIEGVAERLCPDAPVPVVDAHTTVERPGGAGLAAVLARRADAEVTLVTAIADDEGGRTLRRLLAESDIELVAVHDGGSTAEKTRIIAAGHPLLRIDRGRPGGLGPVPDGVARTIAGADAVLVADYGRGLTANAGVRALVANAAAPVVWDPHPRGAEPPPGITLATPNRSELDNFAARIQDDHAGSRIPVDDALRYVTVRAAALRARWGTTALAVTLGPQGAAVVGSNGPPLVVPVNGAPATGDACGAGDAFATAAALALARHGDVHQAVVDAVGRASTFVGDGGVGELLRARLPARWPEPTGGEPWARARAARAAGRSVVATGGCFDVLHAGHVATLQRARSLGQHLVVLLNGDESVRRLKGEGRPVQTAADRAAVLRSLGCVDDVVVFDEDTPVETLRRLRPDVFVKGGDYNGTAIPETDVLASWGGVVVTVPLVTGRSTTSILDRASTVHPAPIGAAR